METFIIKIYLTTSRTELQPLRSSLASLLAPVFTREFVNKLLRQLQQALETKCSNNGADIESGIQKTIESMLKDYSVK